MKLDQLNNSLNSNKENIIKELDLQKNYENYFTNT